MASPISTRFLGALLGWLVVLGGLLAPRAYAVDLVRGPTVEVTETNAVVRWTTDTEAGTRVAYSTTPGRFDTRVENGVAVDHEATLTGLRPGTTYHFTFGTARFRLGTNSFTTRGPGAGTAGTPPPTVVAPKTNSTVAPVAQPPPTRKTWGNVASLQDHFNRHGPDFSARNPDDYAAQAWLFLQRAKAEGLPAKRDADGVLRVYDPKTRAFAAYNRDGTTKTYFKPGRRNYFDDQPGDPVDLRSSK